MNETEVSKFSFFKSYKEAIDDLGDDDKLAIYEAITNFVFYGIEPDFSGIKKTIFTVIRPNLMASIRDSLNGQLGGAKQGNQNARKTKKLEQKQPPLSSGVNKRGLPKGIGKGEENGIGNGEENGIGNGEENGIGKGEENGIGNNVDATTITRAREVKSEDEYIAEYTYTESMKVQSILSAFNIPSQKWSDVFSAIVSEFKQRDSRHKDSSDFDRHIRNMLMIWNSDRGDHKLSTLLGDNLSPYGLPKEYYKDGKLQYALNDRSGYR